ncbi:MAG: TatD family hydrolase [Erysipelotrichaceae bacterium]|nr:TatD family hydrolase [Erysipelotrichaceae bacterium]
MSYWIDSHAHMVDEVFQEHFDEYMQRAKEYGVGKTLCICLNLAELKRGFQLQQQYPQLDLAVGYYPSDIPHLTEEDWQGLEEAAQDERVIAIGEIGLDYYWDKSFIEQQKEGFIRQIELANRVNKPVLVHARDASLDTYDILKEHPVNAKGILHCYSGSKEMAKRFEQLGMYFSFAGPLTFKNSKVAKEVAKELPLNRMFVETDSPYLTPEPHRGKQNETAYVKYVGEYLAELKQLDKEIVQKQMIENYQTLFNK